MGVRTLYSRHQGMAVMYCSTTDWSFGPVFDDDNENDHEAPDRINLFIDWLKRDPREFSDIELEKKYGEWRAQEAEQWKAKEKETEMTDKEIMEVVDKWFATDGVNLKNLVRMALSASTSIAGSTFSVRKAEAARLNGMKGGRPRKNKS